MLQCEMRGSVNWFCWGILEKYKPEKAWTKHLVTDSPLFYFLEKNESIFFFQHSY
jgi:hypothetical protein